MNEQQIQQILTIQQAITAAATAAVINSLLNPQQNATGLGVSPNPANAITEALQNHSQNQLDLQQVHHQHQQPDSRQDSPIASSGSPLANNPSLNDANRLQELLLQLQQQAVLAGAGGANALSQQQHQEQAIAAALNLNLNSTNNNLPLQQLQSQLSNSPLGQSQMGNRAQLAHQAELNLASASATVSNISNQSSPNKKLKNRHLQQPTAPTFLSNSRSSLDSSSKPQLTPKSHHSNIANLVNRNSSNNNSSSSSSFLPNNVGLPRKLVRGQDVWLGRGAEQTRQILKCMWCGQSFRTLAEMTQHMRETQHYTNIISQEQITSWRQPDVSETSSNKQHQSKQSSHNARLLNEHPDDVSERFNDSEDSFSQDESSPKQHFTKNKSRSKSPSTKYESSPSADLNTNDSSSLPVQGSAQAKSTSKNRKRGTEDANKPPSKREKIVCDEDAESTSNTSPSQPRVLSDLNEDSEANKEGGKSDCEDQESTSNNQIGKDTAETDEEERAQSITPSLKSENVKGTEKRALPLRESPSREADEDLENDTNDELGSEVNKNSDNESSSGEMGLEKREGRSQSQADEQSDSEQKSRRRSSRKSHADITSTSGNKSSFVEAQKVDASGDPLSALETMVEKSFDPRLRPGIASGGILQRLGIDEEVCPPWQHINYANWYAAAAYGHPMAAALLAAGINLQNGIKLGKNLSSKKADED